MITLLIFVEIGIVAIGIMYSAERCKYKQRLRDAFLLGHAHGDGEGYRRARLQLKSFGLSSAISILVHDQKRDMEGELERDRAETKKQFEELYGENSAHF